MSKMLQLHEGLGEYAFACFWCICVLSFFRIGKLAAVSGFPTYHLVDTQENGHYFHPSWPIRTQETLLKDHSLDLQGEMVFAFVL